MHIDPLERLDEFAPHDGPVIDLPGVTAICCESRDDPAQIERMRRIVRWHRRFLRFGAEVWVGASDPQIDGVEFVRVERWRRFPADYSRWCLTEMHTLSRTPRFLTWQWDGFVLWPELWTDEFLGVDYIGPPTWSGRPYPRGHPLRPTLRRIRQDEVGNGGFSLRSVRLHEIATEHCDWSHPDAPWEDVYLCVTLRERLERQGMRWASVELGRRWGQNYLNERWRQRFGFHGDSCFANAKRDIDARWLREQIPGGDAGAP